MKPESDIENDTPLVQLPHHVRNKFIRNVYSLLSIQLLVTTAFCANVMIFPTTFQWLSDPAAFVIPFVCSIPLICGISCLKHRYPHNLILLTLFTICETFFVAHICIIYQNYGVGNMIVIAFAITMGIFTTLSAFVHCSKHDFSFLNTFLSIGLLSMIIMSIVQLFVSYTIFSLIMGWFGIILFSGYILYDTSQIIHQLGPDDTIEATLMLYLDIINLFVYILQVLQLSRDS